MGNRLTSSGTNYTNNSSNELTAVGNNTTYTYDNNGNNGNTLTKVVSGHGGGTTSFAWDFENRLTSVTLPGSGGTVSFKYDPFGRRIYKSSSSATSIYAYDGDNLVEETNSSGTAVARYSDGLNIDEPLAMLRSSATSYHEADGLGSVTSLSNSSGSIANTYTYDSFGNLTASTGTLANSFRYTARESDSETSLYYYRARYYDTGAGRFLSEDPIRWADGASFYIYARNLPTFFRDPSGRIAIAPGFPDDCVSALLNALNVIKDRIKTRPGCTCWFLSSGIHAPLEALLAFPFTIRFDPNINEVKGEEDTLAYVWPGDPFNIYVTAAGYKSGPTHLAQDIVHELGHIAMGHATEISPLSKKEHDKVRLAEAACGFAIQVAPQTIVVH